MSMYEQELEKIIEALRELEARFELPATSTTPHLSSVDRALFKRLMFEAKGILDAKLGLHDFGVPLIMMTNLSGYGAFNPPQPEQLQEAIGLVEGGLNQLRLKGHQANRSQRFPYKPTNRRHASASTYT